MEGRKPAYSITLPPQKIKTIYVIYAKVFVVFPLFALFSVHFHLFEWVQEKYLLSVCYLMLNAGAVQ